MASKYIDVETGEIRYEPDFVKLYIKELCSVKGLSAVQNEMFKFMLRNMNHENLVSYGSITKNKFLEEHNIKSTTFNNNIKGLILSGLIERVAIGEFRVNKKYAVKVDWAKVQEIKWETTYNNCGKTDHVIIKSND
ncbi:hypothetical protein [Photobacterium leiognathi]|uniref:hypothetical protein n=1 Tax=Photobacterium leiognathi TaxID=553611 RepID=UPI002739AF8A|nr:hypothetical protein [Photobacterium leiognathi]